MKNDFSLIPLIFLIFIALDVILFGIQGVLPLFISIFTFYTIFIIDFKINTTRYFKISVKVFLFFLYSLCPIAGAVFLTLVQFIGGYGDSAENLSKFYSVFWSLKILFVLRAAVYLLLCGYIHFISQRQIRSRSNEVDF
jgi:hypothetical protein